MNRMRLRWLLLPLVLEPVVGDGTEVPVKSGSSGPDQEVIGIPPASPSEVALVRRRRALDLEFVHLPGGTFKMGSHDGPRNERPAHLVHVSPFRISRTEVTVSQYRVCVQAGVCAEPPRVDNDLLCTYFRVGGDQLPVNCITYQDALTFAYWVGADLPTETQWEFAARGREGRTYLWGESAPVCTNVATTPSVSAAPEAMSCGTGHVDPVCAHPAGNTPEGLCDMAGNLAEWVRGIYVPDYYYYAPHSERFELTRHETHHDLVCARGGAFNDLPELMKSSHRRVAMQSGLSTQLLGFRLVDVSSLVGKRQRGVETHNILVKPLGSSGPPPDREPTHLGVDAQDKRRAELGIEVVTLSKWVSVSRKADDELSHEPDRSPNPEGLVISAFRMTKTEVTVAQYQRCVDAAVCTPPLSSQQGAYCNWGEPGREHHPVNCVTYIQAETFAQWVGGSLPTELQWERARWVDPTGMRFYPRMMATQSCTRTVFHDWVKHPQKGIDGVTHIWGQTMGKTDEPCAQPVAITRSGLCDMDCNVWEWTSTWYTPGSEVQLGQTGRDPVGPTSGELKVLRGGAYADYDAMSPYGELGRDRDDPGLAHHSVGFRVVFPLDRGEAP